MNDWRIQVWVHEMQQSELETLKYIHNRLETDTYEIATQRWQTMFVGPELPQEPSSEEESSGPNVVGANTMRAESPSSTVFGARSCCEKSFG